MASFFAEIDAIGAIEEIFTSELDYIYGFGAYRSLVAHLL